MLCKWNNGYSDSASEHAQAYGSAELEKKKEPNMALGLGNIHRLYCEEVIKYNNTVFFGQNRRKIKRFKRFLIPEMGVRC